ncbi:hypothetical protein BJY04DRAFT_188209 [Aspergillus karnatakaensis]|uniref:uncharacterized protein n=1 Tax=Aspergillus karnatakaensis TaxID=1810916 RepID=UPI003CCDC5F5
MFCGILCGVVSSVIRCNRADCFQFQRERTKDVLESCLSRCGDFRVSLLPPTFFAEFRPCRLCTCFHRGWCRSNILRTPHPKRTRILAEPRIKSSA